LKDLQAIAKAKAREYMVDKTYYCSMATLLAVNDALKDVDEVNYADLTLIKAIGPLAGGMGAWEAPCGAVAAGSAAIGLKYGASDPSDLATIGGACRKSGEYLRWFKYSMFGSYNCFDIKPVGPFTPAVIEKCASFVSEAAKKLVEILTEGNPKVTR
jgi:hypothetical protein